MPPPYSAKKIAGKPAYELARAGQMPELKPARVTIADLSFDALDGDTVGFAMHISSGGYVRSVAHELGQRLGCGAHLSSLRRTAAGPFVVSEAWTLEALLQTSADDLPARMRHPRTLLPEMPAVTADENTLARLRNGMQINLPEFSHAAYVKVFASQAELAAIAKRVAGSLFQPEVVLAV